ncbi:hypothetical protein [Microbulbifer variabilis]|uniref:hypothetical protein n=1 Tax=Microbulbifer variabilis TaxID=266805 RepID=UPI001CFD2BDE|nr:hypothetical protein [Microbulbifer variabilis]
MIKKIFVLAGALLVGACSLSPYKNFNPRIIEESTSIRVISNVQQNSLTKEAFVSPLGTGGAVISLVEAGHALQGTKTLHPFKISNHPHSGWYGESPQRGLFTTPPVASALAGVLQPLDS